MQGGQEPVITVWQDGTWRLWGAMDAYYAQSDAGYVATIPLKDIMEQTNHGQVQSHPAQEADR